MSALPESIEEGVGKLQQRVNLLFEDVVGLEATTEEHEERIAELQAENEQLREELEQVRTIAEQSMTVASRGHNPDCGTKVDLAKRITRNELIRRTATGASPSERPITVTEVRDMARPDEELKYQTVKDAWGDLTSEWGCFTETTKRGDKAIGVRKGAIKKSLTRAVEMDLDRTDLTKRLISDDSGGGV